MIDIIPSKSFAHRAIILSGLSDENCSVICGLDSDDILATREAMDALMGGEEEVPVRESGSTLRFLIPVAAALGKEAVFLTSGRLYERPLGPLIEELGRHGAKVEMLGDGRIKVSGELSPGTYSMPGNVSSQYITGLLLALPMLTEDSRIDLTTPLESSGYVDITLEVMRDFGITVEREGDSFIVKGGRKYTRKEPYKVEGDWSGAAFWLAGGAAGLKEISVRGLNRSSAQGDRKILEILGGAGARIELDDDVITTYPSELDPIDIDICDIPDLAPAIAVIAAAAKGVSHIRNAGRLRLKESDRVKSIVDTLNSVGIGAMEEGDEITISGAGLTRSDGSFEGVLPVGGKVDPEGDHRICMMASMLSLITAGSVTVRNAGAVAKSYPGFYDEMKREGLMDDLILEM